MNEKMGVVTGLRLSRGSYLRALAGALLAWAATGCGAMDSSAYSEESQATEGYDTLGDELSGMSNGLPLPARDLAHTVFKVCWNDLDAAQATRRSKVKQGAELWTTATDSWLTFTGWDTKCSGQAGVVPLWFEDRDNCASVAAGIVFPEDGSNNYMKYCGGHEFGHAIGLAHEHQRLDGLICPNGDEPRAGGGPGNLFLGPPDHDSIMSYCAGVTTSLSAGDVEYIKKLIGPGEVKHGKNYALRLQTGHFVFPLDNGSMKDISGFMDRETGKRKLFRITRESGSGDVMYGDKIALNATIIDPGGVGVNRYVCLSGTNFVSSTSPCYWTVARTAGGGGGDKLNVNDPFRLRLGNVTFEDDDEKDLRMIGDFANTSALELRSLFSPLTHDGVAVRSDDISIRKICQFRGYIGGVLKGTWTGAPPAAVKAWEAANDHWWLDGKWVAVANTQPVASWVTCYR